MGAEVADLQTNVEFGEDAVTGTLLYYTNYTGFSGDPELQEGNYLALKVGDVPGGTTVTVELIGGHSGPVELDEDMNAVLRIEATTQKIKLVATNGDVTITKVFNLTGLTLTPEG